MSLIRSLGSAVGAFAKAWRESRESNLSPAGQSTFDGARDNPARSGTIWFPIDSSRELVERDRVELVKKHRSLRNNLGFLRGINRTTVDLAVGWGLVPMPGSGNREFDRRAKAYWKRNTARKRWDVTGRDNQAMMQRLVLSEVQTDGEIFKVKIRDDFGNPQRQLIKTEQVGNSGKEDKNENWVNGVLLNSLQRPLRYRFLKRELPGTKPQDRRFEDRLAGEVCHIFERERTVQVRGLPWGYAGINDLVDALDLIVFEKIAHKLNAAIIGSIKSSNGEMPASFRELMGEVKAPTTESDTREAVRFLDIHGSMVPLFKDGDGLQFHHQGRSVINVNEFVALLFNLFSIGYGLPPDFLWGMSRLGGASVRGVTDLAGRFFERVMMMMIEHDCQPDYEDVIGTGILAYQYPRDFPGVEPLEPPPGLTGWNVVEWRGPKNVTVDKGRDGRVYLELMRAGKMTDQEWWTMSSEDPDEMRFKPAEELQEKLRDWKERGLPEDMFWRQQFGNNTPAPLELMVPGGGGGQ